MDGWSGRGAGSCELAEKALTERTAEDRAVPVMRSSASHPVQVVRSRPTDL
jgi:hypothetical protein